MHRVQQNAPTNDPATLNEFQSTLTGKDSDLPPLNEIHNRP